MNSRIVPALKAVTATTTSEEINVKYAEKIVLQLTRANHSSGASAFKVSGSVDGTTYVDLAILRDNVAGINTLVASKTLSADGVALVALDLESGFAFESIKVTVTETTDGTHSASVYIEE